MVLFFENNFVNLHVLLVFLKDPDSCMEKSVWERVVGNIMRAETVRTSINSCHPLR
jgi:hypothetical protein